MAFSDISQAPLSTISTTIYCSGNMPVPLSFRTIKSNARHSVRHRCGYASDVAIQRCWITLWRNVGLVMSTRNRFDPPPWGCVLVVAATRIYPKCDAPPTMISSSVNWPWTNSSWISQARWVKRQNSPMTTMLPLSEWCASHSAFAGDVVYCPAHWTWPEIVPTKIRWEGLKLQTGKE